MKKILIIALSFIALTGHLQAQPINNVLPLSTIIEPYKIEVGYYTTTVLAFPAPIEDAYWGSKELIGQKPSNMKNVLTLKAGKEGFKNTNVHVFTSDGKLYAFEISYAAYPTQTTFDLNKLTTGVNESLLFTIKTFNPEQLKSYLEQVRQSPSFFSKSAEKYKMTLELQSIHLAGDMLLFGFAVNNQSSIPFDIDFTRLYIRDKQKAKRSSVQQTEIQSLYKDALQTVPGNTLTYFIIATPKFTIPDNKEFIIEMYEKNGGRNISMKIKNRFLLKARTL